jgi:hypothetical protein
MSRPLRIEYAGAVYHITSRGNKKKPSIGYSNRSVEDLITLLKQHTITALRDVRSAPPAVGALSYRKDRFPGYFIDKGELRANITL